jgi:hypothetical protein
MSTALTILRHARPTIAGWVALGAACIAVGACSNNNPQAPDGFIAATITEGSVPGLCPFASQQTWLDVGVDTTGKPQTVQNGNQNAGATVDVTCTVSAVGNGFDVILSISQGGLQGGSVTVASASGQGAVTASGGTVSGTFESESQGAYRDSACTITYTYMSMPVPDSPPIAAGRIWGHLSCPNAVIDGQFGVGADGGPVAKTCDGEADFLFEQCGS